MALTVIVKNDTTADAGIEDLGISIPASTQIEMVGSGGLFTFDAVVASDDLKAKVSAGILIINNGTSDLNIPNGIADISFDSGYSDSLEEFIENIILVEDTTFEVLVDDLSFNVIIDG